jgi:hypothetical protein
MATADAPATSFELDWHRINQIIPDEAPAAILPGETPAKFTECVQGAVAAMYMRENGEVIDIRVREDGRCYFLYQPDDTPELRELLLHFIRTREQ